RSPTPSAAAPSCRPRRRRSTATSSGRPSAVRRRLIDDSPKTPSIRRKCSRSASMPASPQYDRVRQLFADQFEEDGDGYLFRMNLKGPAVQVSADERDAFVATFNRSFTRLTWGLIATLTAFTGMLLAWVLRTNVEHVAAPIYIGI